MRTHVHPVGDEKTTLEEEVSEALVGEDATSVRAVAARANYLPGDRPDI